MKASSHFRNQILLMTTLLILSVIVFDWLHLDILLEDYFYNFASGEWLIDRNNKVLDTLLYTGIKKLYIVFVVALMASLGFFWHRALVRRYKKGLIIVLLSSILIPAIVGGLKAATNTPCPKNIEHYNGTYPYVTVLGSYPEGVNLERIRCFPAAHASGGFALMSLFYLFETSRNKRLALSAAMVIGWSTGLYKMMIGDHFLSHTVVTMIIAWLVIQIIASIVLSGSEPPKSAVSKPDD